MPELPEVEVVRRGLARWVESCAITDVEVLHPRPVRRHEAGPADFAARLRGRTVQAVARRGKFLWLELDGDEALMAHLGMSGQLLLEPPDAPPERHLRVRLGLSGAGLSGAGLSGDCAVPGRELRFVDQRMFGGLTLVPLVPTADGRPGGHHGPDLPTGPSAPAPGSALPGSAPVAPDPARAVLPLPVAHIGRDALDPHLDERAALLRLRTRRSGVKRVLLDQSVISGIGNIYADEALWRSRMHYARPCARIGAPAARGLLREVQEVMLEALAEGGTSFDSLYVDVNGRSGYFDRSLAVYGQQGRPCPRCGTAIVREPFMNRSSFRCPRCQRRPTGGVS